MRRSELSWVVLGMLVVGLLAGFFIGVLVNHTPERNKPETVTVQKTVPGPERTVERTVQGPERTVEKTVPGPERTVKLPCKLPDTGGAHAF